MSHLNNFFYLQEALNLLIWFIWSLIRIYRVNGYKDIFNWKNIRTFQMKACATWMAAISWITHFVYAVILCKVKYAEGYTVLGDGSVIYTPRTMYSMDNAELTTASDSILDAVMASKTSSYFMMVAGFHHILKAEQTHTVFVSSREFHIFRAYSVLSVILYPILQAVYKNDPIRTTVAPQLWYCGETLLCIVMLSIITYRMYRYVYGSSSSLSRSTSRTLRYLMWSLIQLICILLVDFVSFMVINIDALTPKERINTDKAWLDISSLFLDMAVTWAYPAQIAVLYPLVDPYRNDNNHHTRSQQQLTQSPARPHQQRLKSADVGKEHEPEMPMTGSEIELVTHHDVPSPTASSRPISPSPKHEHEPTAPRYSAACTYACQPSQDTDLKPNQAGRIQKAASGAGASNLAGSSHSTSTPDSPYASSSFHSQQQAPAPPFPFLGRNSTSSRLLNRASASTTQQQPHPQQSQQSLPEALPRHSYVRNPLLAYASFAGSGSSSLSVSGSCDRRAIREGGVTLAELLTSPAASTSTSTSTDLSTCHTHIHMTHPEDISPIPSYIPRLSPSTSPTSCVSYHSGDILTSLVPSPTSTSNSTSTSTVASRAPVLPSVHTKKQQQEHQQHTSHTPAHMVLVTEP